MSAECNGQGRGNSSRGDSRVRFEVGGTCHFPWCYGKVYLGYLTSRGRTAGSVAALLLQGPILAMRLLRNVNGHSPILEEVIQEGAMVGSRYYESAVRSLFLGVARRELRRSRDS